LLERSVELGLHMVGRLEAMLREQPYIANVRGLGAMVAFDIVTARGGHPDAQRAASVIASAANRGLILLACGTYGNALRILVPLTASDDIVNEGLDILRTALVDTDPEKQRAESPLMQS